MAKIVRRGVAKKYGLPAVDKWYENAPESVVESDKAKLRWGSQYRPFMKYKVEGQILFS